ncbi:MAG: DUF6851 domain-containing protein [Bacteroidia bacterium]
MKNILRTRGIYLAIFICLPLLGISQDHSIAREWNDVLLESIRRDNARPTVHARNLFHISAAMYDAWAAFEPTAKPYFLGQITDDFICPFSGIATPDNRKAAQEEAISYAAYRLIRHRFRFSPGVFISFGTADNLMETLGYDITFRDTDYINTGSPAALGNYIAEQIIRFGLQDGSNEEGLYANKFYTPVNDPLRLIVPGNPFMADPNRWQPLAFELFIDQSGNPSGTLPDFLSPEWGQVSPFALTEADKTTYTRDGFDYEVYHDPGMPPLMDPEGDPAMTDEYKWGFAMVALWSSHLDPADSVKIDISPAAQGNFDIEDMPKTFVGMRDFYDAMEGGDPSTGHPINPATGQPYEPNIVLRGDYTRILAEFWADGPDSETPPGHWFTLLNYVSDHPDLEKKFEGEGPIMDGLEWDVKSYLMLGGAMHDCAIAAWGIKGYYDYPRPISTIRYMADQGQSSDPQEMSYHPDGIPLYPGRIEVVKGGDPLAGSFGENVGKIKLYAWRGPNFILDPQVSVAGVDWILAEDWWPYQRPSFVTPPFAGYVSGHSTYSRAAAEVLTMLTGDPFFPGGMGVFEAPKNKFLVFENGPSTDVQLQWATYRDASDQTSLSRIWGGIHPPADDIPGRLIGEKIGIEAFNFAKQYFDGEVTEPDTRSLPLIFPNPIEQGRRLAVMVNYSAPDCIAQFLDMNGKILSETSFDSPEAGTFLQMETDRLSPGLYFVRVKGGDWQETQKVFVQ